MGAKNHCVVLPDANKNKTLSQIVGAAFGAAGQRCMALSVAIFVGKSKDWVTELVEAAKRLKVNAGHVPGTDLGPVISPRSKKRICDLIETGVKDGATLALDGRGLVVSGFEKGNFVGPTVLTNVKVVHLWYIILLRKREWQSMPSMMIQEIRVTVRLPSIDVEREKQTSLKRLSNSRTSSIAAL